MSEWIETLSGSDGSISEEQLEALARALTDTDVIVDEFVQAVRVQIEGREPSGELELRVGSFELDLSVVAVRTAITFAAVSALLAAAGVFDIDVSLGVAILPSVLEVKRTQLSAHDRMVLADLQLTPAVALGLKTPEEIYEMLPAEVRETFNRYDFADTIERLRNAGWVEDDLEGTWIRIRSDGERPYVQRPT